MEILLSIRGFNKENLIDIIKLAKSSGINGFELPDYIALTPSESKKVKNLLSKEGIKAPVYAVNINFSQNKEISEILENSISCAEFLGAEIINLYCVPSEKINIEKTQELLIQSIKSKIDELSDKDIIITLENELSSISSIASTIKKWFSIVRSVNSPFSQLTVDLANFIVSGEKEIFHQLNPVLPFIKHVHLKDVIPYSEKYLKIYPNHQIFKGKKNDFISVPIGKGIVEHEKVIEKLTQIGYKEKFTLETFTNLEFLNQSLMYLRSKFP